MERYIQIQWQLGQRSEVGTNGCYLEEALEFFIRHLEAMNSRVYSTENRYVIMKLQQAIWGLRQREADRRLRGVLGLYRK